MSIEPYLISKSPMVESVVKEEFRLTLWKPSHKTAAGIAECELVHRKLWNEMHKANRIWYFFEIESCNWSVEHWIARSWQTDRSFIYLEQLRKGGGRPVGFMILENTRRHRGEGHFCIFKAHPRKRVLKGCNYALQYAMERFELQVIYGFVSEYNILGRRFCNELNGVVVGKLPRGSYVAAKNKDYDSFLYTWTREEVFNADLFKSYC